MCDNEYFHGTGVTQAYFQIIKFFMCVYTHRGLKKKNEDVWKKHAAGSRFCLRGKGRGGVDE